MIKADLHTHTVYSDGVLSPEELITKAKDNDIDVLAITDHDAIEGAVIAKKIANTFDISIIIGCEFSTDYEGNEIHVLGYGLDPNDSELNDFLQQSKINRKIRAGLICEKLQKLGFDVSLDDVETKAEGASIGRPHIASVMFDKGYVVKVQEAFDKYIGDGRPAYQKKILSDNKEVFDLIKRNGGISSLAHPEKTISQTKIYNLVRNGLAGIEIIHPYITEYRTKSLRMRAKQYGLYVTGGSDYHGIKEYEEYNFGKYFLDKDNLQKLLIRIQSPLINQKSIF